MMTPKPPAVSAALTAEPGKPRKARHPWECTPVPEQYRFTRRVCPESGRLLGGVCGLRADREHCPHRSCQLMAVERMPWTKPRTTRYRGRALAGPVCLDRRDRGNCGHDSCRSLQLARIPLKVLDAERRDRRRRSQVRDVNANPTNAKGTYYDTEAMREFAVRAVLGYADRIGDGDIDGLPGVVALHELVDQAVGLACRKLVSPANTHGYSWTDVGSRLGVDRRTAWENHHDADGKRRLRGTQVAGKQNGAAA